ncbi:hypothetical protein ACUY3K_10630 [Corynebacterium uberis]|uniref:hypothetical protein n=1 Tax=Corynebacterium TaxID=1716 RepID=UPI001D0BC62D|nr:MULTISPECIES: hypothetical protein [Corynebacterium]MCZ9309486.1 hypothetical protein [Corynebacterium sp. c6VSa_13]UDL73036.1 hypothetical protein LH391_07915 [Corynebacterium uberis]UDL76087.1 hypothetical protein LH393_01475 [Corynebacterium uberis]UDL78299.1 hypothetical protein LH394_01470 [Corynebacterium uberis]UDL80582.1 hypothetical protein LH392_01900 [Corynebacterium uberis]
MTPSSVPASSSPSATTSPDLSAEHASKSGAGSAPGSPLTDAAGLSHPLGHPRAHGSPVGLLAAAIVVAAVAVRTVVAARGWFYWDDLTLLAQAREHSRPDMDLLLTVHDGHLMPAGWLLCWVFAWTAGLAWPWAVGIAAAAQLCCGAAVWWALCRVAGPAHAGARLAGLAVYAAIPLTVPSTSWMASALGVLPVHLAFALVVGATMGTLRHGPRGWVTAVGVAGMVCGCLFSERAALAAPAVTLLVVGVAWAQRPEGGWRRVARAVYPAWAVAAGWAAVYVLAAHPQAPAVGANRPGPGVGELVAHGYGLGVVPTWAGGPWQWERWVPAPPWAAPHPVAVAAGVAVAVAVLWWSRRLAPAWLGALAYPLIPLCAVALWRSGADTAVEIAQTLRHVNEVAVLCAVTVAWVAARRPLRARLGVALCAVWCVGASISVWTYGQAWADQPARGYVHTMQEQAMTHASPLLDQEVAFEVLLPVTYPYNQLSALAPLLGVKTAAWTDDPVLIDAAGALHPAGLTELRASLPAHTTPGVTRVPLDGPLMSRTWVVRLNYLAHDPATASIALDGRAVEVPLQAGLNSVYVQVSGGGDALFVRAPAGVSIYRSSVGQLAN